MATSRTNARVPPSGEKAGSLSTNTFSGGEVSLRLSPDSTESKNNPRGSLSEFLSVTTSDFPSGVQASRPSHLSRLFQPLCALGAPVGRPDTLRLSLQVLRG